MSLKCSSDNKCKTIQLLEMNIGENLQDLGQQKTLLHLTSKA